MAAGVDEGKSGFGRGCLAALLCAFVAVVVGCGYMVGYLPVRQFDPVQWREADKTGASIRLSMVERLVSSGKLNGLTRPQVLALLGPPDDSGYFAGWDLVYWLGPERGVIRIDSEWLIIRFGQNGLVSEYRIGRD